MGVTPTARTLLTVLSGLVGACGQPPVDSGTEKPRGDDAGAPCLNCGLPTIEEPVQIDREPHMEVEPTELTFYGYAGSDRLDSRTVELANYTQRPVGVVNIYVAKPSGETPSEGDGRYFEIKTPALPIILKANESIDVDVNFISSVKTRHALLVFETTYGRQDDLTVSLSGKLLMKGGFENFGGY